MSGSITRSSTFGRNGVEVFMSVYIYMGLVHM